MELEGYSLQTEKVRQKSAEGDYKGYLLETQTLNLIFPHPREMCIVAAASALVCFSPLPLEILCFALLRKLSHRTFCFSC